MDQSELIQQVAVPVLAIGAGWAAQKLVGGVYQGLTKSSPPDPSDLEEPLLRVVTFAAVSAAAATAARIVMTREATRWLSGRGNAAAGVVSGEVSVGAA